MNRKETVHALLKLMQDRGRTDRFLQMTDNGEYFLAESRDYLGPDGRFDEPAVEVPFMGSSASADELERAAQGLIADLDQLWLEQEEEEEEP